MAGLLPLSHKEIQAWEQVHRIVGLEPYEVDGLIYLDNEMLRANQTDDKKKKVIGGGRREGEPLVSAYQPPWPEKKKIKVIGSKN